MLKLCHFCGNTWLETQLPPCGCYKQIPSGNVLYCESKGRWTDLQVCFVCSLYDDCQEREDKQMQLLMEVPT